MAAARIGAILRVIARDAEECLCARFNFERATARPKILVVVFLACGEVGAKPVAAEARNRAANLYLAIEQRHAAANDAVGLIIAAIRPAQRSRRIIRKPLGDIFDRATNCVAAIQRALRPAQHFDPLDLIDIEHGCLGAVKIDIVQIDADACFEAADRILLANAADERRERRAGPA